MTILHAPQVEIIEEIDRIDFLKRINAFFIDMQNKGANYIDIKYVTGDDWYSAMIIYTIDVSK